MLVTVGLHIRARFRMCTLSCKLHRPQDLISVVGVVVVVDFSSLARILGECSTIHSQPALFLFFFFSFSFFFPFFFFFFSGDYQPHTNSTLQVRISPQWLSELRRHLGDCGGFSTDRTVSFKAFTLLSLHNYTSLTQ